MSEIHCCIVSDSPNPDKTRPWRFLTAQERRLSVGCDILFSYALPTHIIRPKSFVLFAIMPKWSNPMRVYRRVNVILRYLSVPMGVMIDILLCAGRTTPITNVPPTSRRPRDALLPPPASSLSAAGSIGCGMTILNARPLC